MRKSLILLAGLLLTACFAASASAQILYPDNFVGPDRQMLSSQAPTQLTADVVLESQVLDRIVVLLSGFEYFPTADDLTAVVANPVPYLVTIAYDDHGLWLPFHHHRAVGAMAYFPTEAVRAELDYLLVSPNTPELMRHHVINALARGYGASVVEQLSAFLYIDDLQLRLTAVHVLGELATPSANLALEGALDVELNDVVRERIQRQLIGPQINPVITP